MYIHRNASDALLHCAVRKNALSVGGNPCMLESDLSAANVAGSLVTTHAPLGSVELPQ